MTIRIDKGDKVKINDIIFNGNELTSLRRLKKSMKKTKKKNFLRIYKRSKYNQDKGFYQWLKLNNFIILNLFEGICIGSK